MVKRIVCIGILVLLVACNNEPVIVKEDTPPKDPNEDPQLIQKQHDDEVDSFIEFALKDEKVMINLEMVPILKEYLQASKNRQRTTKDMKLHPIKLADKTLYVLEFSCQDELCSYLLLDHSEENQAYLVADLAKSVQTLVSPDKSKILFHYNRVLKLPLPLSHVIVFDLKKWEPVTLINDKSNHNLLYYNWPILTVEWLDENTITAYIPDISKPTTENIKRWHKNGKPEKKVSFTIEDNK